MFQERISESCSKCGKHELRGKFNYSFQGANYVATFWPFLGLIFKLLSKEVLPYSLKNVLSCDFKGNIEKPQIPMLGGGVAEQHDFYQLS